MPVEGNDGVTRMVRSCVEGPVFRGDRVRWDAFESGLVPRAGRHPGRPGGWALMGLFSDIRGQAQHPGHSVADAADLAALRGAQPAPGVDMSVDLSGAVPQPDDDRIGVRGERPGANRFLPISELGAFVTKSVMAAPRSGRGTPRMAETPSGMLNSIGLQGPGIEAFIAHDLAWLKKTGARALVVDRRLHERRVRRCREPLAGQRRVRRGRRRRGQHLLPQRREPRAGLRVRPPGLRAR